MTNKTYIIGHKNPDTDSICAAISYKRFKQLQGESQVTAARAGSLNPQTEFVLNKFGVPAPVFLSNVIPTVEQAMTTEVVFRHKEASIKEILYLIEEKNIRLIPVLDDQQRYCGTVSLFDILRESYWGADPQNRREIFTSIRHIQQAITGKILHADNINEMFSGIFLVGAMREDSFKKILSTLDAQKCIIITGDRDDIQQAAIQSKVKALIITGNLPVSTTTYEKAKQQNVNLLTSPYDTAFTMSLVNLSTPAYRVAQKKDGHLLPNMSLAQATPKILEAHNRGMVVLDEQERLKGIITKADLLRYSKPKLILVDHNEISQAVDGADQAEIIEILDHHRLANTQTIQPILFLNQPVGSTCTIIAKQYFDQKVDLDAQTAGLLISGIISDTLNLKSPTATALDAKMLEKLNQIAQLNLLTYSSQMFAFGTSLTDRNSEELILGDFKEYNTGNITFGVGQIEVVCFDEFDKIKKQLIEQINKIRLSRSYHFAALLVTDIISSNSRLVFDGIPVLCNCLDYPLLEPNIAELKGVLSRKKQLLPYLLTLFKSTEG